MDERMMDIRDDAYEVDRMDDVRDRNDALTDDLRNDIERYDDRYLIGDNREYDYIDKEYEGKALAEEERVIYAMGGDREDVARAMENKEMFSGKRDRDFERDELSAMTDQKY